MRTTARMLHPPRGPMGTALGRPSSPSLRSCETNAIVATSVPSTDKVIDDEGIILKIAAVTESHHTP